MKAKPRSDFSHLLIGFERGFKVEHQLMENFQLIKPVKSWQEQIFDFAAGFRCPRCLFLPVCAPSEQDFVAEDIVIHNTINLRIHATQAHSMLSEHVSNDNEPAVPIWEVGWFQFPRLDVVCLQASRHMD